MTDHSREDELIRVLRFNLEEALHLNREFEKDLVDAVRCMEACERERVEQVARLERRIEAMTRLAGQESDLTPSQAKFSNQPQELHRRATVLIDRAGEARFRHTDSLTRTEAFSEVTLRLPVPPLRPHTSITDSRSRSKSPLAARQLTSNAKPASERSLARRTIAENTDSDLRSKGQQRARLAKLLHESVFKLLGRAIDESRDLKSQIVSLETKVRKRQVCSTNAASAFAPLASRSELILRQLDSIRGEGLDIIANECSADELLTAGVTVALQPNGRRAAVITPPSSRFDPADPTSPKWVLIDHRTAAVMPSANGSAEQLPDTSGSENRPHGDWSDDAQDLE